MIPLFRNIMKMRLPIVAESNLLNSFLTLSKDAINSSYQGEGRTGMEN